MKEEYRTVSNEAFAEIVEKRSRFIASVKPVSTEAEALVFLDFIRKKHWDARHNVYAYILEENNIMRYSDDGEPAGTAGVPVLDILKKEEFTNIIVVVTRYFGGILLGKGGLVHAYSACAKAGLSAAVPLRMRLCKEVSISCDYTLLGKIQNELDSWDIIRNEAEYSDNVTLPVYVPACNSAAFASRIEDLTNARAQISISDSEKYFPIKDA